jgi:rfaE bifunctional protein kinase chain/domain
MDTNLEHLLRRFPGRRVLVVGDVVLDEYLWGDVRRVSPEAPVPVVELHRRSCRPGGAANVAANIRSLGGVPLLAGVVGQDAAADTLRQALVEEAVDPGGLLVDASRPTTVKTRVLAHNQHIVRIDAEQRRPIEPSLTDRLLRWIHEMLPAVDVCVLSDYAKGLVTPELAQATIRQARRLGKPVLVDPKGTDYRKYRGATVVKPNVQEAGQVLHRAIEDEADLLHAGAQLVDLLDGAAVLLTRGAAGMSLFEVGREPCHIAAAARQTYDVTGAGDTVLGMLALGLATGAALAEAAWAANRAAGVVVGKVGTATVAATELLGAATVATLREADGAGVGRMATAEVRKRRTRDRINHAC